MDRNDLVSSRSCNVEIGHKMGGQLKGPTLHRRCGTNRVVEF